MSMRFNAVGSAGVREWVNNNSAVVTVVALILVGVAIYVMIPDSGRPPAPDAAWYYVPETKETFSDKPDHIPPIDRNGKQ